MKVLLLADMQLESGQSLGHGEYGVGSRFADQELMLQQIADIGQEEGCTLTLIAGDTFDRPKPSPWAILALQDFLRRQQHSVMIPGNHDVKSLALPSVTECFRGDHVEVYDGPTSHEFPRHTLRVSVLPWAPAASLADSADRDELNELASVKLANTAQQLGAHDVRDGWRHILLGHWLIRGAQMPTGIGWDMLREPSVPLEALWSGSFDLVAFGHIHRLQVLSETPPVIYLGSPWVNNFGEAGQHHGVMIYDTEKDETRFMPVADPRRFVLLDSLDADELHTDIDMTNAVVRVRYEGPELADHSAIVASLKKRGAHKIFVQPKIVKPSRARIEEPVEALTDNAAVELWLERNEHPDPARVRVLHGELSA